MCFVIFVGFGHVYLVKKQGGIDDKKEYAMKLVFPDGYTDKEFAAAYENEFNVREKLTRNGAYDHTSSCTVFTFTL